MRAHSADAPQLYFRAAILHIVQHKAPIVDHNHSSTCSIVTLLRNVAEDLAVL